VISVHTLVGLLHHQERAAGAPSLAAQVGASHLCLFILDPELHHFLPAPGFPQNLPEGIAWRRFLTEVAKNGGGQNNLISPFTSERTVVSGSMVGETALVALFGQPLLANAYEVLSPSLVVLSALMMQEVQTRLAKIHVSMAQATAAESRQLSQSLSDAHDKIASVLQAREALTDKLRKEEEKLHLAHQVAGIGVWELDASSDWVRCTPEAAQIFGLWSDAFDGPAETLLSRIYEQDRESARTALRSFAAGAPNQTLQFRVAFKEGLMRWVETRGSVLQSPDGKTSTILCLSLDITARVLSEQSLIRSERLVVAGRLSASIAHEINNPLAALINLIYLARETDSIADMKALLSVAEEQLRRVSMVAKQSLRFYRDLNTPVNFSLSKVVADVLDLLRPQFSEHRINVLGELDEDCPDIRGWPGEVMQVVTNLLLNAVQASPAESSIRIRVYHRHHKVFLVIADRGVGIAPEHAHRIYEPFFSTKTEGGTGLGLWITQQVIGKHYGTIRMRSSTTPGKSGTAFRIALPDAESEWPTPITAGYRWLQIGATHLKPQGSPEGSDTHAGRPDSKEEKIT
jgi:PAS domain S-box-containing protein